VRRLRKRRQQPGTDTARRFFYCWPSSSAAFGDLLLELRELLLNVGRKVGYLKHPANFDHFVILSGDARGPFERLFARLHLNYPVAEYADVSPRCTELHGLGYQGYVTTHVTDSRSSGLKGSSALVVCSRTAESIWSWHGSGVEFRPCLGLSPGGGRFLGLLPLRSEKYKNSVLETSVTRGWPFFSGASCGDMRNLESRSLKCPNR
jgi:hypothetical protein